jgi:hypothetical protein
MAELLDVLDAFSTPIKIGWVVWIAWGVGQVFWYRQERSSAAAAKSRPAPARKTAAARKQAAAPQPLVTRLVTPEPVLEAAAPKTPQCPPAGDAPLFDPSKAVVETFHATSPDLDSFVADFERRNGHRRGDTDTFGTQPHSM